MTVLGPRRTAHLACAGALFLASVVSIRVMYASSTSSTLSKMPMPTMDTLLCRAKAGPVTTETLCSPSKFYSKVGQALERGKDTPREMNRELDLVARVWRRDASLGENIPWPEYSSYTGRALLALMLAPYARWELSPIGISELREFSRKFRTRAEAGQESESVAIELVGELGTPGEAAWLYSRVRRSGSERMRIEATMALGRSCDPDAETLRITLPGSFLSTDRELAALEFARSAATSPAQRAFCRRTRQG